MLSLTSPPDFSPLLLIFGLLTLLLPPTRSATGSYCIMPCQLPIHTSMPISLLDWYDDFLPILLFHHLIFTNNVLRRFSLTQFFSTAAMVQKPLITPAATGDRRGPACGSGDRRRPPSSSSRPQRWIRTSTTEPWRIWFLLGQPMEPQTMSTKYLTVLMLQRQWMKLFPTQLSQLPAFRSYHQQLKCQFIIVLSTTRPTSLGQTLMLFVVKPSSVHRSLLRPLAQVAARRRCLTIGIVIYHNCINTTTCTK